MEVPNFEEQVKSELLPLAIDITLKNQLFISNLSDKTTTYETMGITEQ